MQQRAIVDFMFVFERILVGCILVFSAMYLCLPPEPYSFFCSKFGSKFVIFVGDKGQFISPHELLFMFWFWLYGVRYIFSFPIAINLPGVRSAIWIIIIALWCLLISLGSLRGELSLLWPSIYSAGRLIFYAMLFLAIIHWTKKFGVFTLIVIVLGIIIGALVNIAAAYHDNLFVLYGQNVISVITGIAVHLSAWLFCYTKKVYIKIFSFCAYLLFVFACVMGYSIVGWFIGGSGLLVWIYVISLSKQALFTSTKFLNRKYRSIVVLLIFIGVTFIFTYLSSCIFVPATFASTFRPVATASSYVNPIKNVNTLFKVLYDCKAATRIRSATVRLYYFYEVFDVISKHPFGVGYFGFYEALKSSDSYIYMPKHIEEITGTKEGQSVNPHSSFLRYTLAGGIPGGVMFIIAFIMLLRDMKAGLVSAMKRNGRVLFMMIAPSFLVIALTLPYLFTTTILIAPVAIAVGLGCINNLRALKKCS